MAIRISSIVIGGLSVAAFLTLFPLAISSAAQQSVAPLRDVCPDGWARYRCTTGVRLCVSPEVERQYDPAESLRKVRGWGACVANDELVPEAWTHATPEELGYMEASDTPGYNFCRKVVKFDSSNIKDGDLDKTIESLHIPDGDNPTSWNKGWHAYKPLDSISLETYGLPVPAPKPSVKEVCPVGWSRFSCQFVRLCVSPRVTSQYNLETSKEFGYAGCKADNRSVGEEDTNSSPHDVGIAAGYMLLGPRYVGVVKLNSSDILDGNIEEAIQRLVLVPLPTNSLIEYFRGVGVGLALFQRDLAKAKQEAKDIENAKSPH